MSGDGTFPDDPPTAPPDPDADASSVATLDPPAPRPDRASVRDRRSLPKSKLRAVDALAVGTVGLRSRRARTVLTALGIAIGIAAMVAVLGISASSRADLLARLDRLGTNVLEVQPGQSFFGEDAPLSPDAGAMVRRIGPVENAAGLASVEATVRRTDKIPSGETGGITVRAAETTLVDTLGATLHDGRFLDEASAQFPTVVLGSGAADKLGIHSLDGNPAVWIAGEWFTVIGILDPVELAPGLDQSVFVGFPYAIAELGIDGSPSTVYARTETAKVDAVRAVLPATVSPDAPNEVKVVRPSDAIEARAATDDTFTALLLGLGGVALLVGGVGIANVMVISVLERRNEIGVRRAIGATRSHIVVQFLIEAILLAGLGGAAGILLGAVVTVFYAGNRGWMVSVPAAALAGGIGVALVIGGLAGLYPALRAARLAPAEAVRPV
jgi:putative ABC transport system permease protein